MAENKSLPIKECPYCGGKYITIRQHISGSGEFYINMDDGTIEGSELHSYLHYRNNKYATCMDCGKRLCKTEELQPYLI